MGYGAQQIRELEQSINNTPADVAVIGTPIDLGRILKLTKPAVRVRYELEELGKHRWQTYSGKRYCTRCPDEASPLTDGDRLQGAW